MTIGIDPRRVARFLAAIVTFLITVYVVGRIWLHYGGPDYYRFNEFFNVDHENTLPTVYSYFALFLCSLLLSLLAAAKRQTGDSYAVHWMILAGVFWFLALDEALALHERLIKVGIPWASVYAGGGVLFLLTYRNFIRDLPTTTRNLFILAGLLFVGGGVGIESLAGWRYEVNRGGKSYQALVALEEASEMGGIVVFIYALLAYIAAEMPGFQIVVQSSAPHPAIEEESGDAPALDTPPDLGDSGTLSIATET